MIDTRAAYNRLTAANLPAEQADAVVALLREVEQGVLVDLATKSDLKIAVAGLKTDIAELKADVCKAIALQGFVLLAAMVGLKLFG